MIDVLQKLFGSSARVKLLRLFLFSPKATFTTADSALRARVTANEARREINLFLSVGVVIRTSRGKVMRYGLNGNFSYVAALQNLLLNAPARGEDIVGRLRGVGSLKLIVLSGIFVGEWDGRIDMFVVGDKVVDRKIRERVRQLEAEIGKEIRFALLASEDFFYRLNMNDKLVRDVFDYPHRIVLDKLNIGLK